MNRRGFLSCAVCGGVALAAALESSPVSAEPAKPQPPDGVPLPTTDKERIAELVTANHILADRGILGDFGHITVRSAVNPSHFFMARDVVPGLVTADDIIEFDENSNPVSDQRKSSIERYIHGEVYRLRPDVYCVLHSHADAVLPYGVTKAPLKAMIHTAYFLGDKPVPVWDQREAEGDNNQMLVTSNSTGASLAKKLGDRNVVLMRGHGMVVVSPSIRDTVFRGIYTCENAIVEEKALQMGDPVFLNEHEVKRWDPVRWDYWAEQAQARRKQ